MGPLDATWHLLNFFAPALFTGLIAAGLAKLLWWRRLRGASWWRLGLWAAAPAALALLGALVLFGRDGKMAGYALMVVGCALGLGWGAFRPVRG